MSCNGPTLADLMASNPAAKEFVESFCDAVDTASSAPLRCALRRGHEGSHYDALLQIAWQRTPHDLPKGDGNAG